MQFVVFFKIVIILSVAAVPVQMWEGGAAFHI
jgi:hypothetical protein